MTAAAPPPLVPPVPAWRPQVEIPLDRVADRFRYYTNGTRDFVVFAHGTCVLVDDGASDADAVASARRILDAILHAHPDVTPQEMDDGNLLLSYRFPAYNVVLDDLAAAHADEIDRLHLQALTPGEVLLTPLGPNVFDAFGRKVLWGRCFMFMDAQAPAAARIERRRP